MTLVEINKKLKTICLIDFNVAFCRFISNYMFPLLKFTHDLIIIRLVWSCIKTNLSVPSEWCKKTSDLLQDQMFYFHFRQRALARFFIFETVTIKQVSMQVPPASIKSEYGNVISLLAILRLYPPAFKTGTLRRAQKLLYR